MKPTRCIRAASILAIALIILGGGPPTLSAARGSIPGAPVTGGAFYPDPHPILTNLTLRQGLAHCTDRAALAQAAYPALTQPEIEALMIDTFFRKDHWAYTQPSVQYPYDPVQGQALLEQAGWTLPQGATYRVNEDGEELALVLTTNDTALRYAYIPVLEAQWLECGVRLVRLHAPSEWVYGDTTGFKRRDFEIASFAWTEDADPQVAPLYACDQVPAEINGWQGANYTGWCNPVASAEAYLGDNTALTQDERKAHYAVVQEQFAQDLPVLPLFLRSPINGTWEHLDFNYASPPAPPPALKKTAFRQGLAHCTDRAALAQAAYPALTQPEIDALMMDTFFRKDHWAYTQPSVQYPYDPVQGQALLEQAGWTLPQGATYRVNEDGEELALVLTTSDADVRYAYGPVLEAQWLECGVRLVRLHTSWEWIFGVTTGLQRRDFEIAAFAWTEDADPQVAPLYACDQVPAEINGWQGANYTGWCNPVASAEAYLGDNTALTQDERKAHYAIVQEQFAQDLPVLPLFLRSPINGTWEHLDFYMAEIEPLFLPLLSR